MTQYDIPPTIYFALLVDDQRRKTAQAGIKELIWQYYQDFTDATELDGDFLLALHRVTSSMNLDGAYISDTLDEVIRETENEINDFYGHPDLHPYNGSERHGNHASIATPGLDLDDEED